MKNCPIVEHHKATPTGVELLAVDRLVRCLTQERPSLRLEEDFADLIPHRLDDAPALHLDDLTAIPHLDAGLDVRFYQERARLRAGRGDMVATSAAEVDGYEAYCREKLGLGTVEWLQPRPVKNSLRIAEACWEDETIRSLLLRKLHQGELYYLHPHMSTFAVWELAALLRDVSKTPLRVIGPPPRLSAWVNDKIALADVVTRLFGKDFVPRTSSAWNLATLAQRVRDLASSSHTIAIKLPSSAGGDGTIVLDGESLAGRPLGTVREELKQILPALEWNGDSELLVDSWETQVACSPSAQLWIPPDDEGDPIVEGIFTQDVEGPTGVFVGGTPATLPTDITQEIATRCWLLARLFQRLGYVGRCSFDLILVGTMPATSRLEFIECNGRWGGTSAPMTLMNRLFGDWTLQPFVTRVCDIPALNKMSFQQLVDSLGQEGFDQSTATGHIVLSIPGRMAARGAIDVIGFGADAMAAEGNIAQFVRNISLKTRDLSTIRSP